MTHAIGFASETVGRLSSAFKDAEQEIAGTAGPAQHASGVPELGGVDTALGSLGRAVEFLNAAYERSLSASAEGLNESLASLLAVEQEIVEIVNRAIGSLS